MDMKEATALLNQIPLDEVARHLGFSLPKQGSVSCPLPDHNDTNPSFSVFAGGTRWKCYGCDRSGGPIDLVKNYLGLPFIDAKKWLGDHSGLSSSESISGKKSPQLSIAQVKSHRQNVAHKSADPEILENLYKLLSLSPNVWRYMVSRGFSESVIDESGVVEFRPTIDMMQNLISKFGFDRVMEAGLLSKKSSQTDARFAFPVGSAIFPFFESGVIVNLQARVLKNPAKFGKWRNLNFVSRSKYNSDVLYDRNIPSICVCEGITDTLSAKQLGLSAVGILGVSTHFTDIELSCLQGRIVYILTDWDSPGEKKAAELSALFKAKGIMSIRKKRPSPSATDLNEYLIEKSK
jgi:DNA primase